MRTFRTKVFISGPLSTSGERLQNVKNATFLGEELIRLGYAPMIPHLSHYMDENESLGHAVWLEVDLAWLASADFVYRISGPSKGADMETALAEELGIPVVYSIQSLEFQVAKQRALSKGCPVFKSILSELWEQHLSKSGDYGTDQDPLDNIHSVKEIGIEPWIYAFSCAMEASRRVRNHLNGRKQLSGEKLSNALLDAASWSILSELERRSSQGT